MGFIVLLWQRAWRDRRGLAVLAISVCLVTSFLALAPLYVRAMIQSGLQYTIGQLPNSDQTLTFISTTPFKPETWPQVTGTLGNIGNGLLRIARSGTAFGGYDYIYGEPTTLQSAGAAFNYHAYAFSDLQARFTLVAGRYPNRLPPPSDPARSASSEQERIDKGLGMYSAGEVEALISSTVATETRYEIGTRFAIGEDPSQRVVVVVVGIVDATNPADPLWEGNRRALDGETVQVGLVQTAFNMAFIVTEAAYSDWVAAATSANRQENNSYLWVIPLNSAAITADTLIETQAAMAQLSSDLAVEYRGLITLNPLAKTLNRYRDVLATVEPPVLLLATAALSLMLYHLIATIGLYLEQRREEWAALSGRGASLGQLLRLQGGTMALICALGALVGPFLALALLQLLMVSGPLAAVTSGTVPLAGISANAFALSGVAALAAWVMLTLPAFPAARRSLAQFKQLAARPPLRPLWARYGLDLIFIGLGVAFLGRLLFFVQGDLGETLALLFSQPSQLIQVVIDGAARTGGLADPFNLLGAGFLLTGAAMLWLRIFPLLMRLLGVILRRLGGLVGALSTWQVARDPGHYGQLVLLLIGTLALGTAALALEATRDVGTWQAALSQNGAALRVETAPNAAPDQTWAALPGVRSAQSLIWWQTSEKPGYVPRTLLGLDPAETAANFAQENLPLLTNLATLNAQPQQFSDYDRRNNRMIEITVYPVIISARMAEEEGLAVRVDKLPLQVGNVAPVDLYLPNNVTLTMYYQVVGIVRNFPSLAENTHFMLLNKANLISAINTNLIVPLDRRAAPNQVWLGLAARQPSQELVAALGSQAGFLSISAAWDTYQELLRQPLPAAVAGMLYAGFWVSLLLSLLDFGTYLAATARRRAIGYAVLQAMGWQRQRIWAQVICEQAVLVLPALVIGVLLGVVLGYLILPFLSLAGGVALVLPAVSILVLIAILLVGFTWLAAGAAAWLVRLDVNQTLRLGEE
jgi:FtsX-like permease family